MNIKRMFKKVVSFTAAFVLAVGLLPSFTSKAEALYESAYDFDDVKNLKWDLSGQHQLVEYRFDPFWIETGRDGFGVASYCSMPHSMFSNLENLIFALHIKPEEEQAYGKTILYVGTGSSTNPYISFELSAEGEYCINIYDGNETATASFVAKNTDWSHVAFVFSEDYFSSSTLSLYYNGVKMSETSTNIDLSSITGRLVYMEDLHIDNLYISNKALDDTQINYLSVMSVYDYFIMNGLEIAETQPDSGWVEDDPYVPDSPSDPSNPSSPEEWFFPEGLTATNYTWIAYNFDGSFNFAKDMNKQADAIVNEFESTLISVSDITESGGRALTRREAVFPTQYISLDKGLLFDADEFSIAMKVYRKADKESDSYKLSNMNLLEFTGKGSFVFSPFKTDELGEKATALTIDTEKYYGTDPLYNDLTPEKTYNLTKTSLSSVNGRWVHYALTFSSKGVVNVYINGVLTNTFETGINLSDLDLTELKIMTGSSEDDDSRYYIDDIYMASRVLDAADIRRIEHYGVSRFVTEVLPDPNPDDSGSETEDPSLNIDLRPDSTDELEDSVHETAEISGFVGTTFDNMSLIGADYNSSVFALVRNASLAQGSKNYGLALDGMSSYIRYPLGILDNADEFTISIAYNWAGSTSGINHRLFDFSRKESSVSAPTAYMYLDMGNGSEGLKFVISDGTSELVLTSEENSTNKWIRVSVTIKNGIARLYIDGAEVASGNTSITPSMIKPNYNYIGKSGVKGGALFKGTVDEIYISDTALTAVELQEIQNYGIEPYTPTVVDPAEQTDEIDIWDTIINGVVLTAVVFIIVLVIIIVITLIKK
ncbi:MAG: hypothetical protein IJN12_02190 [Clostridia bacterium]|nr:hypothetical protein [Clostridia bacterium]